MRWMRFSQWTILPKILFISFLSVSVMLAVAFFYFIPNIQEKIILEKKAGIRHVVEVVYGVANFFYGEARKGTLEEEKAKQMAIAAIKQIRYREKEYFWINDNRPYMVMHPNFPELDGQPLADYADPTGKKLFIEFVKVTTNKGQGYVDYHWPKPGEKEPVPKISFVKAFVPWGWVIGSGIYLDDVRAEIKELRIISVGGALLFAVVTLLLAYIVGRGITRRLSKVISGLKDIASGQGNVDLHKRISITSIDEIGTLSSEFNALMESIASLTHFKKVIEEDDTLEDVYARLWETFNAIQELSECVIYEVDVIEHTMRVVYPPKLKGDKTPCDPEVMHNCDLCKANKTGHGVASIDFPRICRQFLTSETHDHVCLPMSIGGGTVGVVQFVMPREEDAEIRRIRSDNLYKAEQYIKEALPVIEAKRLMQTLRESALRDPLTGLHNRRFLQECADNVCFGARRRGKNVGLLMCDLDYFKQVNDTFGHNAGDTLLKLLARLIRDNVRAADLVIRFGGEEFLVLLVDIDPEEAERIAEKVLHSVSAHEFSINNGPAIRKTISIGVGVFPKDSENFWDVLKFADMALYQSKSTGRNRSTRFTPKMISEEEKRTLLKLVN
ncbi:MAG: diguanylate cyclase [Magnetococcales bacterium]|nr:diguanylate cyclase [Magnetococcales bacterium]